MVSASQPIVGGVYLFYKHKRKKAMAQERQPFFAWLMLCVLAVGLALVLGLWANGSLATSANLESSPLPGLIKLNSTQYFIRR